MSVRNVVFFITDGHRKEMLGCYGNELLETPRIDGFAQDAVRFDHAFCPHSVCMPTRASLYTGRYPHVHGVWANGLSLSRDEVTMPQVLSDSGWTTGASGKVHFEPQQMYPGPGPACHPGALLRLQRGASEREPARRGVPRVHRP